MLRHPVSDRNKNENPGAFLLPKVGKYIRCKTPGLSVVSIVHFSKVGNAPNSNFWAGKNPGRFSSPKTPQNPAPNVNPKLRIPGKAPNSMPCALPLPFTPSGLILSGNDEYK